MTTTRDKLPVACIMGPTASGKTGAAVALAQRFPVRVISVDSAQVYRGMDIGTAKPDAETLRQVPHRLIDICDPEESYSAARFREDARREIQVAHEAGRLPLLVGGTMLYFRALEHGLADLPPADAHVRKQIENDARERGWGALHAELASVDPASARRIHPNDAQRIQRALEIFRVRGESMSALLADREAPDPDYAYHKWVFAPSDRAVLNQRIAVRFDGMLEQGFIDEVAVLRRRPDLGLNHPAMRAVGYRQVWQYLDGDYGWSELREKGVIATRQFAKRQMTWLRKEADASWLDPDNDPVVDRISERLQIWRSGHAG